MPSNPSDRGNHLIVVAELFAFSDESGGGKSDDFGTIAGFVASPAQWEKFRQGWRAVLDAVHVDTFHASDFFPRESWKSSESPYRH